MMMRTFLAAVVLIMIGQEVSYCQTHAPRARKGATVVESRARFTVLTPRVIRMEWSEDGRFEDRASLTFVIRDLPVPEYSVTRTADGLAIKTSAITLRYRNDGNPFNASNLSAHFGAGNLEGDWHPGMENKGNLLGTTRTLDSYDGTLSTKDSSTLKLEPGMLSRDGWVMIDDSERPLFDDSDYPWVVARDGKRRQDYYFFAYGRDYKVALKDFIAVAGRIALPPRFAFGYWFSRWRSFSEMEFRELVGTFKDLGVPLDVLVIDMDWHLTSNPEFFTDLKRGKDQAKQDYGWTGYTWNKNLFPDPKRFLDWTDAEGLKTCLNLHPASGLQPH